MPRPKTLKKCSFCSKEVYNLAGHGLCAACYYREKRNGTPEYTKVRKPCSVEGCERQSVAQSLCDMHYHRLWRTGDVTGENYDRRGHASVHPLYNTYSWMFRGTLGVDVRWKDFWSFVADVGERPTPKHRLYRLDTRKDYGPDNFEWRQFLTDVPATEKNEYMRAYRMRRPRAMKGYDLKRYGLTSARYEEMRATQNGLCIICSRPERAVSKQTGMIRDLAVDHDHVSGAIRDLLCSGCNRGLGYFDDDPELLRAAADYLDRHKRTQEVPE